MIVPGAIAGVAFLFTFALENVGRLEPDVFLFLIPFVPVFQTAIGCTLYL